MIRLRNAVGLVVSPEVFFDFLEVLLRRRLVVRKPPSTDPTPLAHAYERTAQDTFGGEFWGNPKTRTFAELLIDCEEDRVFRAVLVGMLWEVGQAPSSTGGGGWPRYNLTCPTNPKR